MTALPRERERETEKERENERIGNNETIFDDIEIEQKRRTLIQRHEKLRVRKRDYVKGERNADDKECLLLERERGKE